jgi:hypothetical protein
MSSNCLSLSPSKTAFLLVGLPQQLSKLSNLIIHLPNNVTPSPVHSTRNLGVITDSSLSFGTHFYCFQIVLYHIRDDLRCIRDTIDHTSAYTIDTSLIHAST